MLLPAWYCVEKYSQSMPLLCLMRNYLYGSGSGSVSRAFHQKAKIWRKTFAFYSLWLLIDLLSLKTDVNAPTVSKKQTNWKKTYFFVGIFKAPGQKSRIRICKPVHGPKDVDPDLYKKWPRFGTLLGTTNTFTKETAQAWTQWFRSGSGLDPKSCRTVDLGPDQGRPKIFPKKGEKKIKKFRRALGSPGAWTLQEDIWLFVWIRIQQQPVSRFEFSKIPGSGIGSVSVTPIF